MARDAIQVYRAFVSALGASNVEVAASCVDVEAYTEQCVGFTDGWVRGFYPALESFMRRVVPNLAPVSSEEIEIFGAGERAVARMRIGALHTGTLFGRPATNRRVVYEAIDMVRVVEGRIVWRYLVPDLDAIAAEIGAPTLLGGVGMRAPS